MGRRPPTSTLFPYTTLFRSSRTRIPGTRPVERLLVPGIDHVRLGTILHTVPVIGTHIDPARLLDECSRALPDRPLKCSSRTGVVSDLDRSLPRHVSVNSVEDFIADTVDTAFKPIDPRKEGHDNNLRWQSPHRLYVGEKSVLLDPPQNKSDGGGSKGILGMHQLFDHVDLTGPLGLDTARLVYGDVSPDSRSDLMHDSHSVLGGKKLPRRLDDDGHRNAGGCYSLAVHRVTKLIDQVIGIGLENGYSCSGAETGFRTHQIRSQPP